MRYFEDYAPREIAVRLSMTSGALSAEFVAATASYR
jgi:hypothetical protein